MEDDTALGFQREFGKVWGALRDLRTTLIGIDGTNGVRSRVIALEAYRSEHEEEYVQLREELRHYRDVEREETCWAKGEFARRDTLAAEEREEEVNLQVAKIQAKVQQETVQMQNRGILVNAIISSVAIIIVALIAMV